MLSEFLQRYSSLDTLHSSFDTDFNRWYGDALRGLDFLLNHVGGVGDVACPGSGACFRGAFSTDGQGWG